MKLLVHLFCAFGVIFLCEGIPKRYHGIKPQILKDDNTDYKLPSYITPKSYDISLEITKEELEKNDDGKFSGTVNILFKLSGDRKNFPIHFKDLEIESIEIKNAVDKRAVSCNLDSKTDVTNDQHTVTCDSTLPENLILTAKYSGILRSNEMYGLYRSTYKKGDTTEYIAATQFEEIGARRVFPCFDQPDLKATFDIVITHPKGYTALSNRVGTSQDIADDQTKTTFTITPAMSTYLVAFVVSKLTCTDEENKIDGTITNTACATSDTVVSKALEVAPSIIKAMEDVTNVKYDSMKVGKFAQVALPDFKAGAMENWGLLTYRERLLLLDDESSERDLQNVLTVIAHEISHQWFGDKVTLNWWSDIFLNEGFATFFEYFTTFEEVKHFELPKQFVIEQLQKVLLTDSDSSSLPLHYEGHDDPQTIESRFDDIGYNKGGSMLQMLNSIYGKQFNVALQNYLNSENGVGTLDSLLKAFEDATTEDVKLPEKVNVSTVMSNWFKNPGYPLLTVKQDSSNDTNIVITISQQRFFNPKPDKNTDETKWHVPISYATKSEDFTNIVPTQWLLPDKDLKLTIEKFDWFVLNNQQTGYFRVDYDKTLLKQITDILNNNITQIDEITRSALVDDQFNLARAGVKSWGDALKFAQFLENDDSYYSWYSALNGYDYLFKHTDKSKLKDDLKGHVKDSMQTFIKSTEDSTKTGHLDILARALATDWACKLGDADCLKSAKESFENYQKNDTAKPDPNIRSTVFCYGLNQSNNKSEAYDFLWSKYQAEETLSSQKVEILKSLGCVGDDTNLEKYLETVLTNDVKLQDVTYVFQSVYSNGGVVSVVNFIQQKYEDIKEKLGVDQIVSLVNTLADFVTNSKQTDELKKIKDIKGVDDSVKTAVDSSVKKAEANIKLTESVEKSLSDFFGEDDNNSAVTNSFFILNFVLILGAYVLV